MLHDLVAKYGPEVVFINVLGAALGLPIPATPTLIVVGASMAMAPATMWPHLALILVISVCASLLGDTFWFSAGRRYGNKTLYTLCKLSLSRDTCMKQTERFFGRWGMRVLFAAKFIPGLSLVSVPLAGAMGVKLSSFLKYDSVGAALWAACGLAVGAIFAYQLDLLFAALNLYGRDAGEIALLALAGYVAYRWWRRHAIGKTLATERLTVDELSDLMNAEKAPVIFDIRSAEKRQIDPFVIPGAQFADERHLEGVIAKLDPLQKVVIYCSCPNEVSAAWMAKHLRQHGIVDAVPLLGGLEAWRDAGRSIEALGPSGAPRFASGSTRASGECVGEQCAAELLELHDGHDVSEAHQPS